VSLVLTKFSEDAEIKWKEIVSTCANHFNSPEALLPIVCSTIAAQPQERLWEVEANSLREAEFQFFNNPQQVEKYGPLVERNQATCACLLTSISRFYSQHTRRSWIPKHLANLCQRWNSEVNGSQMQTERTLRGLFDLIDPTSADLPLLDRMEVVAMALSPNDPDNPLLGVALEVQARGASAILEFKDEKNGEPLTKNLGATIEESPPLDLTSTLRVVSPIHGSKELEVIASQSIQAIKDELEKIYGGNESLASCDLVFKPLLAAQLSNDLVVLDCHATVGDYPELSNNKNIIVFVVPSQIVIVIHRSLDPSNSWFPPLEFAVCSKDMTLRHIKSHIADRMRIPREFQRLVCGGRVLEGEVALLPTITRQQSSVTIELLVDRKFQSNLAPAKYRDPIIGLSYVRPVRAADGLYSQPMLESWCSAAKNPKGVYTQNPIDLRLVVPEEELDQEIKAYLNDGKLSDISTLDTLAGVYAVLEPVQSYLRDPNFTPAAAPTAGAGRDPIKENTDKYLGEWSLPFIPQVVVLGDENCGKSTLLQRLTMDPTFPYLNQLCTTSATILQFRRGPVAVPQFRIIDQKVRSKILALVRSKFEILDEMESIGEEVTTDVKFVVEITHPMAPNLDVIDLPGLLSVNGNAADIVTNYINDRSLYLCALTARSDDATETETALARVRDLFNPNQHQSLKSRTVGVFTQFDRAEGTRPELLKELCVESAEKVESLGYPAFPWRYVLTMASGEGHIGQMVGVDGVYESIQQSAKQEMEYFSAKYPPEFDRSGCNSLVTVLQAMHLEMLSGYLTDTVGPRLQRELQKLHDQNVGLGLPEAHEYHDKETRDRVKESFISSTVSLIGDKWAAIESAYETEYLGHLSRLFSGILQSQSLASRSAVQDRIKKCRGDILEKLGEAFGMELAFWAKQIHDTLNESSSGFKLNRFPCEIELVEKYAQDLALQHHNEIARTVEQFLAHHFDGFTGAITISAAPAGSPPSFELKFSGDLVQWLLQIFSSTLSCFDPTRFATDPIRRLLEHSPFIEEKREERYDLCQQICLLNIAISDLDSLREASMKQK
jgi:hypothetical protein